MGLAIEFQALQAAAMHGQGKTREALVLLQRALSRAEREGHVRVFVDVGPPMADLLRRALSQGITAGYAGELLQAFDVEPETRPTDLLSERELEVLQLVASGLSNRGIAEQLTITVGTAKRHVSNIYAKLGVHSRVQATARARELDLLPL